MSSNPSVWLALVMGFALGAVTGIACAAGVMWAASRIDAALLREQERDQRHG